VLRALDTIEDDMTLPSEVKQSLLRSFHIHTVTPGWNFEGSGPNERDRQLLVEYHNVVEELNLLAPRSVIFSFLPYLHLSRGLRYKSIIIDITQVVEVGMADYARIAYEGRGSILLTTIANYNRYCHYVGGIPGEGFFRVVSVFEEGEEQPCTGPQLEISNSAALFLQKLDLIRDYREDIDENRYLWPQEIWSRKEYGFSTMREMYEVVEADVDSERVEKAMYVQSEMVSDALLHATDMLDFLRMIKNPAVFDIFARLLCFSFAKLEMSFMNRKVFLGNVKLRKAESAWVSPFHAFICLDLSRSC
jgi:farnesyl-diphosphate farnesyltransferase